MMASKRAFLMVKNTCMERVGTRMEVAPLLVISPELQCREGYLALPLNAGKHHKG